MYHKDKTKRFIVRMSEDQEKYICSLARSWGISKSEMLRKLIDSFRFGGIQNEDK